MMNIYKQQKFPLWLQSKAGQDFLTFEKQYLQENFAHFYSENILSLGSSEQLELFRVFKGKHYFVATMNKPLYKAGQVHKQFPFFMQSNFVRLPIMPESMDTILMFHTLEQVKNPVQVLQEVSLVMKPQAYLLLIGFNPLSFWGLHRFFSKQQRQFSAKVYNFFTLKRYLAAANLKVITNCYLRYLSQSRKKNSFISSLIGTHHSIFSHVYVTLIQKEELMPLSRQSNWTKLPHFSKNGFAEPATRTLHDA